MNKKLILVFAINFINSAPGSLDTSFGTDGIATASGKDLSGLALYSNQKIIVAGSNTDEDKGIFIRFLTNGTVDTTFATSGTLSLSNNVIGLQPSIATYLGNRIFPGGRNTVGIDIGYRLYAYNNEGERLETLRIIPNLEKNYGTIIDSNDKIISMSKSTGNKLAICKDGFDTNTNLFVIQNAFGTSGFAIFDGIDLTANGAPSGIAVNSDNDIFVCYYLDNDTNFRASKIKGSDGTLDTSFNTTGSVTIGTGGLGAAKSVAIQSDGKVVLVGGGNSFIVMRLNTDGSLDETFGELGLIIDSNLSSGQSVAIQDDGKIIAGGKSSDGTSFGLARYNSDGTIDTTFGESGYVSTPSGSSGAVKLAIQDDGKIIAAGSDETSEFIIARYESTGETYLTANTSSDSVAKNTSKTISISGSNSQSTELLTFAISTQPSNGTLGSITQPRKTGNSQTATLIYTPNTDFTGTDSFAFTITDGSTTSDPATVTLSVSNFGNLSGFVQRLIEKY